MSPVRAELGHEHARPAPAPSCRSSNLGRHRYRPADRLDPDAHPAPRYGRPTSSPSRPSATSQRRRRRVFLHEHVSIRRWAGTISRRRRRSDCLHPASQHAGAATPMTPHLVAAVVPPPAPIFPSPVIVPRRPAEGALRSFLWRRLFRLHPTPESADLSLPSPPHAVCSGNLFWPVSSSENVIAAAGQALLVACGVATLAHRCTSLPTSRSAALIALGYQVVALLATIIFAAKSAFRFPNPPAPTPRQYRS